MVFHWTWWFLLAWFFEEVLGSVVALGPLPDSSSDGLTTSTRGNSSTLVSILCFLLLSLTALLLVSRWWSYGSMVVVYALLGLGICSPYGGWLPFVVSRLSLALVSLAMLCWS